METRGDMQPSSSHDPQSLYSLQSTYNPETVVDTDYNHGYRFHNIGELTVHIVIELQWVINKRNSLKKLSRELSVQAQKAHNSWVVLHHLTVWPQDSKNLVSKWCACSWPVICMLLLWCWKSDIKFFDSKFNLNFAVLSPSCHQEWEIDIFVLNSPIHLSPLARIQMQNVFRKYYLFNTMKHFLGVMSGYKALVLCNPHMRSGAEIEAEHVKHALEEEKFEVQAQYWMDSFSLMLSISNFLDRLSKENCSVAFVSIMAHGVGGSLKSCPSTTSGTCSALDCLWAFHW